MKNYMRPDKELIERFLKNECSGEEAETVVQFFTEHPDQLENHLPANAWLKDFTTPLNATVSNRILQQVRNTYSPKKRVYSITKMLRFIAAASLVGLATWQTSKLLTHSPVTKEKPVTASVSPVTPLKTIENLTGKIIRAWMPDSSVVTLYPNSQIEYLPGFEQNRRNVYLKGKALFDVSKDKTRPFTVYASGIATTALGTKFIVSVLNSRRVSITLKEGAVKVALQHSKDKDMTVVLRPGDEIVVNSRHFRDYTLTRAAVPALRAKQHADTTIKTSTDSPAQQGGLAFKNQPLKKVFLKIEEKFGVTVHYKNVEGIDEKLFTGTFLENDSLEFICTLICRLQDLQYRIEGNRVTISTAN